MFEQDITVLQKAEKCKNSSIVQCSLVDGFKALGQFDLAKETYLRTSEIVPGK